MARKDNLRGSGQVDTFVVENSRSMVVNSNLELCGGVQHTVCDNSCRL